VAGGATIVDFEERVQLRIWWPPVSPIIEDLAKKMAKVGKNWQSFPIDRVVATSSKNIIVFSMSFMPLIFL